MSERLLTAMIEANREAQLRQQSLDNLARILPALAERIGLLERDLVAKREELKTGRKETGLVELEARLDAERDIDELDSRLKDLVETYLYLIRRQFAINGKPIAPFQVARFEVH